MICSTISETGTDAFVASVVKERSVCQITALCNSYSEADDGEDIRERRTTYQLPFLLM